jgi:hypothetical protein
MRLELRSEQEVREDKEIDKSECSISFGTNRLFCGKNKEIRYRKEENQDD